MRAFVVRPFGEKGGVNFETVHDALVAPALARLGLGGGTTGDVIEAGNIREDMFQLLLVSDVVVADISIDNANTYYELGIRHALREQRTFLIRAKGMTNTVPFDLSTDRYLAYDPADPAATLDALVAGLRATIESDRQDSPVFRMLPELREQDRSRFLPIPREFRDEAESAAQWKMRGKLALLAYEAEGTVWESEGLRLVGRQQFDAKAFEAAAITLEALRALDPLDVDANLLLGTIYERLSDLPRSEQALRRVLAQPRATSPDLAEAWSLLGRNLKTRWRNAWEVRPSENQRAAAHNSPLLMESFGAYLKGFHHDLNHFFSGLNALGMITIAIELAGARRDEWNDAFDNPAEAHERRRALEAQRCMLVGAVELSIDAAKRHAEQTSTAAPWVDVSLADFRLLTAEKPGPVVSAYRKALDGQPDFIVDSVRRQLRLYQELQLFPIKVDSVLPVLPLASPAPAVTAPPRTILFTGHQADAPGRPQPRFPADKEPLARAAIRQAVLREMQGPGGAVGIAGAASGGDILFHEVCAELGVPTHLYLALPPEEYIKESVAPAAGEWIRRFWTLKDRSPSPAVLARRKELPGWLAHRRDYSIWHRNNLWMLNEALSAGAQHVTVLALWDGRRGDGPGGTADMIALARRRGAAICVLDTNVIFDVASRSAASEGS